MNVNGDTFNVLVDNQTIKIDNGNHLSAHINYKAGDGITIDNEIIKTKIDNLTIQANPDGEIHALVPKAGSALSSNSNKFDVNVDGTTIKINANNQLTAIKESKSYTAGDGININDNTIAINQNWFDIRD